MAANNTLTNRVPQRVSRFPYNNTPPIYGFQIQTQNPSDQPVTLPLPFNVPLSDIDRLAPMQPYPLNAQFIIPSGSPTFSPAAGRYKIPPGRYKITFGGGYELREDAAVTDQVWAQVKAELRLNDSIILTGDPLDVGVGNNLRVGVNNFRLETFGWSTVQYIDSPIEISFVLTSGIMLDATPTPVDIAGPDLFVRINGALLLEMVDLD